MSLPIPPVFALFGSFGIQELLIILLIVLVLFGAKKVPEIMRSFGQGIREFKRESHKMAAEFESTTNESPKAKESLPDSTEGQEASRPTG